MEIKKLEGRPAAMVLIHLVTDNLKELTLDLEDNEIRYL